MRLLVAVPCYNEAKTIADVVARIPRQIASVATVEVLVVDDGSEDGSAAAAETAGAKVVVHSRNRGVGSALQTALDHAVSHGFDLLVNIDADGQFAPEDIPLLTRPIIDGEAEFVTASRFVDDNRIPEMPGLKRWGNRMMSRLISSLVGRRFHDVSCGFRAYSREAMLQLNLHSQFTYTQESFLDLSNKGLAIKEVPVAVTYFKGRVSKLAPSLPQYALKTLMIILRFYRDHQPLRFFWSVGAVFILSGTGFGSVLIYQYVNYHQFSPHIWSGFVGGFLFIIGLGFFLFGFLADMLDRSRRNQERLLYLVKKKTFGGRGSANLS